jgi:hypothetical protein
MTLINGITPHDLNSHDKKLKLSREFTLSIVLQQYSNTKSTNIWRNLMVTIFFLFNMSCKKISYTIVLWFDISFMCVQLFVYVGEGQFTLIKRMSYNQTQVHIEHYKFPQESKEKSIKKYLIKGMINHNIWKILFKHICKSLVWLFGEIIFNCKRQHLLWIDLKSKLVMKTKYHNITWKTQITPKTKTMCKIYKQSCCASVTSCSLNQNKRIENSGCFTQKWTTKKWGKMC